MTLQERQGILRKLTTREIKLQTTMMQPMGKDLGFSVDWLISHKYGAKAKVFTKCVSRKVDEPYAACLPIGQSVLRMNQ